jgi:hypothetical protein
MIARRIAVIIFLGLSIRNATADRYALLVGNNSAEGNFEQLRYVQNDLRSLKGILGDFCGFEGSRIVTMYNGTPRELEQAVKTLGERMAGGKDNLFLFYYSGHADRTSLKMGAESYPLDSLRRILSNFPSDLRIGIFDACQSGSFTRIKGGKLDEPFLFKDDGKTKGQVILCSSSINENAQESDALGNSVFTFHFVNALRGSADLSGDGRVTLSEAYQYAYNHTLSNTAGTPGGVQHPSYQFKIQGEGDIVLADLNNPLRGIMLGSDVMGDITIMGPDNVVVADLNKATSKGVMIALGQGAYRVINGRGGKRSQASITVPERSAATVRSADFYPLASASGLRKGSWPAPDADVTLTVAASGAMFDFSGLASSLAGRFDGYTVFSIRPTFEFPSHAVYPSFAVGGVLRNALFGSIGFGAFNSSGAASYEGSGTNPVDGTSYGVKLSVRQSLAITAIDVGIGYRFQNSYLKNVVIGGGFESYLIDVSLSATFSDALYNIESPSESRLKGSLSLPYVAAGYSYPVFSWLDAGGMVKYRYQGAARAIADDGSASSSLYANIKGVDANVFVSLHLLSGLSRLVP